MGRHPNSELIEAARNECLRAIEIEKAKLKSLGLDSDKIGYGMQLGLQRAIDAIQMLPIGLGYTGE